MYERCIIVQRTVIRWTDRRVPGSPASGGPIWQAETGQVGRPAYEDGILPDKVRAVREIQGGLPHERRHALRSPAARNPATDRRQVTPWWKLGDDI